MKKIVCMALAASLMSGAAFAEPVKIGFVTTLTTGAAVIGNDMKNAVDLAMEHLGGMAGDTELEVIFGDDQFAPEAGKQVTDKLVKQDDVDFVAGYIWSHVLLASRKSVLDADKILISANAGPSQMAGKLCDKNFFSTSWQNDQTPMAMGEVLNRQGVKSLYLMAPNYAAGKDMVDGMLSTFEGEVVGTSMTKWPDQLDFSGELASVRAANPEAVYVFYPPAHALQFVAQYQQAGLKDQIPLYSVYTFDALTIPTIGANSAGALMTMFSATDLENEANATFVEKFIEKYDREPSNFAATAYDTVMLIDSVVTKLGGDLSDKDAVRAALKAAEFDSVRGEFRFGPNNFPIQDFYLVEVIEGEGGQMTTKIVKKVVEDSQDAYAADCSMN